MKKIGALYRQITPWNEKVCNTVIFDSHLSYFQFDHYNYFLNSGIQVQLKTSMAIHPFISHRKFFYGEKPGFSVCPFLQLTIRLVSNSIVFSIQHLKSLSATLFRTKFKGNSFGLFSKLCTMKLRSKIIRSFRYYIMNQL